MKTSKIESGIAFACSIACLFYAYDYFQDGSNLRALIFLVIGVVTGIINFKFFIED